MEIREIAPVETGTLGLGERRGHLRAKWAKCALAFAKAVRPDIEGQRSVLDSLFLMYERAFYDRGAIQGKREEVDLRLRTIQDARAKLLLEEETVPLKERSRVEMFVQKLSVISISLLSGLLGK